MNKTTKTTEDIIILIIFSLSIIFSITLGIFIDSMMIRERYCNSKPIVFTCPETKKTTETIVRFNYKKKELGL